MENPVGLRERKTHLLSILSRGLGKPSLRLAELGVILEASPVDLKRVAAVIRSDAELTARLRLLTSDALSAEGRRIHRLEDALILLGAAEIRNLALACHLIEASRESLNSATTEVFWKHALAVAFLSGRAARGLGLGSAEQAYVGGLLHDAGKLPLLMVAEAERSSAAIWLCCDGGKTLVLEREYFGLDHTEAGRRLGLQWKLAPALVEAMTWHHEPRRARQATDLAGIIAIVNRFRASRPSTDASLSEDFVRDCLPHVGEISRKALLAILRREYPHARENAESENHSLVGQIDAPQPSALTASEGAAKMNVL